MRSGPDTGVDTLHKVEGPGAFGAREGPGPLRIIEEKERKGREKEKKKKKEKKKRGEK